MLGDSVVTQAQPNRLSTWTRNVFRSFAIRNFQRFFIGQAASAVAIWMQNAAELWLVFLLTGSPGAVGLVALLRFSPMLLFALWAGTLADRYDRRRMLIATECCKSVCAGALAVLAHTGAGGHRGLYGVILMYGVVLSIDNPLRRSLVRELVPLPYLTNAVSLNSTALQFGRVVGPAVGGLLIATTGVVVCFVVSAVLYLVMAGMLVTVDPQRTPDPGPRRAWYREAADALRYIWATPPMRRATISLAVIAGIAWSYPVVLPPLVQDHFGGGSRLYGAMFATVACGSMVGATITAGRQRLGGGFIFLAAATSGLGLLLMAVAPHLLVAFTGLVLLGAGGSGFIVGTNGLIQLEGAAPMQGRLMAMFSMCLLGSQALVGPALGWIAGGVGIRWALAAGAAVILATALGLLGRATREPVVGTPPSEPIDG